jgi:ABC-type sulfate transport system permease component
VKAQFDNFDTSGAYAASVVLAVIAIAVVVSLRILQPKEH